MYCRSLEWKTAQTEVQPMLIYVQPISFLVFILNRFTNKCTGATSNLTEPAGGSVSVSGLNQVSGLDVDCVLLVDMSPDYYVYLIWWITGLLIGVQDEPCQAFCCNQSLNIINKH